MIRKLPEGRRHSGIFFDDGSKVALLHLARDLELRVDEPTDDYWWVVAGIDSSIKKTVAGMCSLMAQRMPAVPYAFDRAGIRFDDQGNIVPGPEGKGLTCSTLIVAIFDSVHFPLIFENQWPKDNDWAERLAILTSVFRPARVSSEHAIAAFGELEVKRVKPAEVVGASAETRFPVTYSRARPVAKKIEKELASK
ncbi:MAG: hypothetical protein V4502_08825 [Pseudomonadota bacterium]